MRIGQRDNIFSAHFGSGRVPARALPNHGARTACPRPTRQNAPTRIISLSATHFHACFFPVTTATHSTRLPSQTTLLPLLYSWIPFSGYWKICRWSRMSSTIPSKTSKLWTFSHCANMLRCVFLSFVMFLCFSDSWYDITP